ncbi:Flagellar basal-body rod protein FlgG [Botrimarina colliarenosi]|uniref:Flagellar basal-body rod protein FlgG n=1 Tax=Botrimarina colliarenosi TaxID=2528001 RepID=A0A5C6AIY9_9BACT|nr:flagellar hook-basal body protein [Botrimarina colliarenosi]TWT99370.1 Flagellar basal-body rod protein FlgG [Botrimarina colliarenosi]
MSYGMYLSAEGAKAQSRRLEVISNNMANVNTVGFKPDVAIFQARFAEAIQQGDVAPGMKGLPDIGGGVKTIETRTSFAPGKLERTGNSGDVAILGDGYFAVEPETGDKPLLSRAGSFRVDAQNRLVMADSGRPVLSAGGAPVLLDPTQTYAITADGYVEQGDEQTPLALVKPNSNDDLQKIGGNLFESRAEVFPVPAAQREVAQGFLEMSGANSTEQMMQLIETNRAFEANTQMIRHQDTATGSLISRLLGA